MLVAEQLLILLKAKGTLFSHLKSEGVIFQAGDRRSGPARGRAVKTPYASRDRRNVGTVNFIHHRQLLCGILQLSFRADKVLKYIA